MTGLAGVMAGHLGPGVYRWHTAFAPDHVRDSVEHAGWRFAYVDGLTHQDKATFLDAVAEALERPEHLGESVEALTDCVRDVDGKGTVLLWDCWAPLARNDKQAFDGVLDVLTGRAREEHKSPFITLLRGDGPAIDVPMLDA